MIRLFLLLSTATLAPALAQPSVGGLPDWLAGRWCTAEGARGRTCETWQAGEGGVMLGTSQTVKGGKTVAFEFLRIAMDGDTAIYLPQPGGKPPVAFRAVAGAQGVTFVNPAHDYPQRVHYSVSSDTLTAEISMADGSKAMRWHFVRAR